jgi:hypothetical protein
MDDQIYKCMNSRPPPQSLSAENVGELEMEKDHKEREVSAAFMSYMSGTGVFKEWENNRIVFESLHV